MKTAIVTGSLLYLAATGSALSTPSISTTSNANALATLLIGPGVTLVGGSALLSQASSTGLQAGTFSSGTSSIDIASGVVLSTGNVTQIPGVNTNSIENLGSGIASIGETSTDFSGGASSSGTAFDKVTLQFSFILGNGTLGGTVGFRYVFASEEYINYVGSIYNDVFSFELDGVNVALVPGASLPVAINSVNPLLNSAYYINNVSNTESFPVAGRDFQFDGLTTVLSAQKNLGPGLHTMKFTISDISDGFLDSAVFLETGSFTTNVPEPSATWLIGGGLAALAALRKARKGAT